MRGQGADASLKIQIPKKNHRPAKIKQNSFCTAQTLKRAIN